MLISKMSEIDRSSIEKQRSTFKIDLTVFVNEEEIMKIMNFFYMNKEVKLV